MHFIVKIDRITVTLHGYFFSLVYNAFMKRFIRIREICPARFIIILYNISIMIKYSLTKRTGEKYGKE